MSRFDYQSAAETGAVVCDWRHELVDPGGRVLVSTEEDDNAIAWSARAGGISVDPDQVAGQSSDFDIPGSPGLVPEARTGDLHPESKSRIRSFAGFRDLAGSWQWTLLSTLFVDEVVGISDGGAVSLTASALDAVSRIRGKIPTAFGFDAGEAVEAVVSRLIGDVLPPTDFLIPATGYTTSSGSIEPRADRLALVEQLLEGCGFELVSLPSGVLSARPILPAGDEPGAERWVYGETGIPANPAARRWRALAPTGWTAIGGSADGDDPPQRTVYDLDPRSESYFDGLAKVGEIPSSEYPWAVDGAQLLTAAYGQLRRNGIGPGIIEFETIPNPAIRQGDLAEIDRPDLNVSGTHRVIGYDLPVQLEGPMTVRARSVWLPDSKVLRPGQDPDPSCEPTHSDTFERSDQNLEKKPGQTGGSDEWGELGFSWWVQNGTAIQQHSGTWSLAYRRRPLCSLDQYAQIKVVRVPVGRAVGPAIRGSSQFDGYHAIVTNQTLRVSVWIDGKEVEVLGSVAINGSPVGDTLRIESFGSEVRAKVDGVAVITVSSTRMAGRYVGMNGYGGRGNAAPAVDLFTAGPVYS